MERICRILVLTLVVAAFGLAAGCNDMGIIPTVSYADCDDLKDDIWLQLRQLDFGFFCDTCDSDLACKVGQSCSEDSKCYDPEDETDPCAPSLPGKDQKQLMLDRRVGILAPLYECRVDEQVAGFCPNDIKRRAANKFIELITGDDCNPCDELGWMLCRCQFDTEVLPADNLMLQCLVADGGRKANPLWSGYTEAQEFDCNATINDFKCDEFFFPE